MLVTFGPCGSRPQPGPVANLGVFSRGPGQGVDRKNVGRRPGFIYLCGGPGRWKEDSQADRS